MHNKIPAFPDGLAGTFIYRYICLYGYLYYSYTSPIYYIMDFWKVNRVLEVFATIDYQRLLEASDYPATIDYQTTFGSSATIDYAGSWCLFGGLGGCCGLGIVHQRVKGWRLGARIRPRWRPQAVHFCLLEAAAGGTMSEMPSKAAERPRTAFLRRGSIRTRVNAKSA